MEKQDKKKPFEVDKYYSGEYNGNEMLFRVLCYSWGNSVVICDALEVHHTWDDHYHTFNFDREYSVDRFKNVHELKENDIKILRKEFSNEYDRLCKEIEDLEYKLAKQKERLKFVKIYK